MGNYERLLGRVRAGEKLLIDGATGSEMERRGVPEHSNGWFGGAALSHPEILREVHAEYIETGANLVISNTFATHLGVLRDAGVPDDFERLNRRSVEIAVEARDAGGRPEVVVAAGVSHWSFTGRAQSLDALEHDALEQMAIMECAGAEVFVLEMMVSIDRMRRLITAAKTTGLPVWVGFSVGGERGELPDPSVMSLRDGDLLEDAIDALDGLGIDVVSIMHTDVRLVDACLDVVFARWDGPVGVYAHSWPDENPIAPRDYAALGEGWLDRGVALIGGCCGTEPAHLRALAELDGLV